MKETSRDSSSVLLGMVAQVLQLGVGLLIMPVALITLRPEEIGLWYVFFTVQSLVLLLDFGFTQTFARSFSYVFAGAQRLVREGVEKEGGPLNQALLAATVVTARKIYLAVAVLTLLLLATLGSWYVYGVSRPAGLGLQPVAAAWALFVLAVALNIYLQWQTSLLLGAGRVATNYKIVIASRVVQLLVSVGGLLIYPSLLTLVLGYVAATVTTRLCSFVATKSLLPDAAEVARGEPAQSPAELFSVLFFNASRLGWVAVGAFLVNRFSFFAVAYFLGLEVSGQYAIAFQAMLVMQALSQVVFTIYLPRIANARVKGDLPLVQLLFVRSTVFAWAVFALLGLGLVFAGPALLELIHSNTTLPSRTVLVVMAIVWFLETNHANCAMLIVTGNRVPFVPAALLSGLAIAAGTLAAGFAGMQLLGLIAVQGLVQAAYNNWKWPLEVVRELGLTLPVVKRLALGRTT
jgi:O-antigen/teichoic acid export membrane protein